MSGKPSGNSSRAAGSFTGTPPRTGQYYCIVTWEGDDASLRGRAQHLMTVGE